MFFFCYSVFVAVFIFVDKLFLQKTEKFYKRKKKSTKTNK